MGLAHEILDIVCAKANAFKVRSVFFNACEHIVVACGIAIWVYIHERAVHREQG